MNFFSLFNRSAFAWWRARFWACFCIVIPLLDLSRNQSSNLFQRERSTILFFLPVMIIFIFHFTLTGKRSFYSVQRRRLIFAHFCFSFICFVLPSNPYSYLIEFTICFEITAICVDHARSISNESTRDKRREKKYIYSKSKHTNTHGNCNVWNLESARHYALMVHKTHADFYSTIFIASPFPFNSIQFGLVHFSLFSNWLSHAFHDPSLCLPHAHTYWYVEKKTAVSGC